MNAGNTSSPPVQKAQESETPVFSGNRGWIEAENGISDSENGKTGIWTSERKVAWTRLLGEGKPREGNDLIDLDNSLAGWVDAQGTT